jgi:hypothetical protein
VNEYERHKRQGYISGYFAGDRTKTDAGAESGCVFIYAKNGGPPARRFVFHIFPYAPVH